MVHIDTLKPIFSGHSDPQTWCSLCAKLWNRPTESGGISCLSCEPDVRRTSLGPIPSTVEDSAGES